MKAAGSPTLLRETDDAERLLLAMFNDRDHFSCK